MVLAKLDRVPPATAAGVIPSTSENPPPNKPTNVSGSTTQGEQLDQGAHSTRQSQARPRADRPYLMFRSTALGDSFGHVSLTYLDKEGNQRLVSSLACDRVHYSSGVGLCLEAKRSGLTTYYAHIFDAQFTVRHSYPLAGPPSRARVSRDGRMAAFTVFVSGHSYASPGFTTRTSVVDTQNGRLIVADLESLAVIRDGAVFKKVDFNFWGVTFASDSSRFYASLGTAGKVYLVEGDLAVGQMRVIHEDVECPSLSPDNTRIAFKRRSPIDQAGRRIWRLYVMNLASRQETLLDKESRNVDDQVEWLNNLELLYALPADDQRASASTNIWALAASAAQPPRLLVPAAFSPAAVQQ